MSDPGCQPDADYSGDKSRRSLSDDRPGHWRSLSMLTVAWLGGCIVWGAGLAWFSLRIQEHFAPLVLFPLLIGAALGAGLVWWSRAIGWSHRPLLIAGVALAVLSLVVGQHVLSYLQYRRSFEQARLNKPQLALFESMQGQSEMKTFTEFLSLLAQQGRAFDTRELGSYRLFGWQVWLSWLMDAVVMAAGASVAFWLVRRSGQSQNEKCKG
jgi:hypothetical protein